MLSSKPRVGASRRQRSNGRNYKNPFSAQLRKASAAPLKRPTGITVEERRCRFAKPVAFSRAPSRRVTLPGGSPMNRDDMHRAITLALGVAFTTPSFAEMSCTALGTYLGSLPHISHYVPPPTPAVPNPPPSPFTQLLTTGGVTRCEANFIYSARGGPAAGYAVGQSQRI